MLAKEARCQARAAAAIDAAARQQEARHGPAHGALSLVDLWGYTRNSTDCAGAARASCMGSGRNAMHYPTKVQAQMLWRTLGALCGQATQRGL